MTLSRATATSACPVRALEDWFCKSETTSGQVFRKVDRWGNVERSRLGPDAWRGVGVAIEQTGDDAGRRLHRRHSGTARHYRIATRQGEAPGHQAQDVAAYGGLTHGGGQGRQGFRQRR